MLTRQTDYIRNHPDCPLIEKHLAENHILATQEDNDNDMFHTILSILLHTLSKELHTRYINAAINKLDPTNKLRRLLKDKSMVFALLELFRFDHFRSRNNLGTGLSMCTIASWYPKYAGVHRSTIPCKHATEHISQAMCYVATQCAQVLHFLSVPVDFCLNMNSKTV